MVMQIKLVVVVVVGGDRSLQSLRYFSTSETFHDVRISVARATGLCRSSVGTIGQLHCFEYQGFSSLKKIYWFVCREGDCKHGNSVGFMRVSDGEAKK